MLDKCVPYLGSRYLTEPKTSDPQRLSSRLCLPASAALLVCGELVTTLGSLRNPSADEDQGYARVMGYLYAKETCSYLFKINKVKCELEKGYFLIRFLLMAILDPVGLTLVP